MACVKHQKRIKELEHSVNVLRKQVGTNAASQALQEDNAKLAEQNATLVEQLHSCADAAQQGRLAGLAEALNWLTDNALLGADAEAAFREQFEPKEEE